MSRPHPLERALWIVALALVATAAGVFLWKRDPAFRNIVGGALQRVATIGHAQTEELSTAAPASGPVRLSTRRASGAEDEAQTTPWMQPGAHGPDLRALEGLPANILPRRWSWEDVNTVPIVGWEGDTRVVKPGAKGRSYAVRVKIDVARALAMERAFGYRLDKAVIRYHDDGELAAKRASLDSVLSRHGVRRQRTGEGDVLAPDYDWMVQACLDDVRPVAQSVLAEARKRGARGVRDEFGALASFVQQMKYAECPDPGDGKHRFGLSTPLWALATNTGDCDTRAVLLLALVRSVGLCEVFLVRDGEHQHMLAAAAVPTRAGDKVIRPAGRTLVLVETTDEWPLGHVASRTRNESLQTLFLADAGSIAPPAPPRPGSSPQRTTSTNAPRAGSGAGTRESPTRAQLPR